MLHNSTLLSTIPVFSRILTRFQEGYDKPLGVCTPLQTLRQVDVDPAVDPKTLNSKQAPTLLAGVVAFYLICAVLVSGGMHAP